MALTRSALREKGITEKEILDYIMEEHGNTVESTKEKLKESADSQLGKLQKTIDDLTVKLDAVPKDSEDYKIKYDELKTKYDTDLATEQKKYTDKIAEYETNETTSMVTQATLQALKDKNFSAKALEEPMFANMLKEEIKKLVPAAKIKDGKLENIDELTKPFLEGMKGFVGETKFEGAKASTHETTPASVNNTYTLEQVKAMTPAQINESWDKGVRQAIEGGK